MVIGQYFFSLLKTLFVFLIVCLFVPLLMYAYNYAPAIIVENTTQFYLFALPWFVWFHQIFFSGFKYRQHFSTNTQAMFVGALCGAVILSIITAFLPKTFPVIQPQITYPENNIITTEKGTLLLDIGSEINTLSADSKTKALWVGDNNILFNGLKTNNILLTVFDPVIYQNGTYMQGQGELTFGFKPSFYRSGNLPGQRIVDTWIDSVKILHFYLTGFRTQTKQIPTTYPYQIEHDIKGNMSVIRQIPTVVDHINRIIKIFNIMLGGALLGVLAVMQSGIVTSFAIMLFGSIVVPNLIPWGTKLSGNFAEVNVLPHVIVFIFLSVICGLTVLLKFHIKEKSTQKTQRMK